MTRDEQISKIAAAMVHHQHKRDAEAFLAMLETALAHATVLDERVDPLTERVAKLETRMDALEAPATADTPLADDGKPAKAKKGDP